jgi:proline iminopeptidase
VVEARAVVVGGVSQVYRVAGDGPVCLVHAGRPGVVSDYLRMPALEQGLTMVYVDGAGPGGSGPVPAADYSPPQYGDFVRSVLDDIGAPTAYFLGHARGGTVALQLAIDSPDRLDGLILYDTAPLWSPRWYDAAVEEMASFLRCRPSRPEPAPRSLTMVVEAYLADRRRRQNKLADRPGAGLAVDANRLPVDWDVRGLLHSIDVPALVVVGSNDFVCPPRFAYGMCAALPDAWLCELGTSGHFGHNDQPRQFKAAVLDFINRQELMKRGDHTSSRTSTPHP